MRVRVGYGGSETVMRITAGIIEEQERTITSCEYLYIFCG